MRLTAEVPGVLISNSAGVFFKQGINYVWSFLAILETAVKIAEVAVEATLDTLRVD